MSATTSGAILAHFQVRPTLVDRIGLAQSQDPTLKRLKAEVSTGLRTDHAIRNDGLLVMENRLCVPDIAELKKEILEEAYSSAYAMHPGSTKMYHTLKEHYWWNGTKKEIAEFVSKCLVCQQVKPDRQKTAGPLQPLPIPEWKWEHITMDFLFGLPCTQNGHDGVWVIVDRLTKTARFLPIKITYSLNKLAKLYVDEIVSLYGAPVSIVSDRDPRFTSKFWPSLQEAMGTKLHFSTAFHPQIDGQSRGPYKLLRIC